MCALFTKTIRTPRNVIPKKQITAIETDLIVVGKNLKNKTSKLFNGSLAIRQIAAGSDNACEQELVALGNSFYDIERFGVRFVASPRHADMLLVTGPVARNMAAALKTAYDATPDPKIVVAIGDDAIDGGIWKGGYAVMDGVGSVIPVDYQIPGDPPEPIAIVHALLEIMEDIESKANDSKKDKK
jgi:Ni,Fe-hydrogenase III small subunit